MLKEVAITLLSFSGLLFGFLLAKIAKDEIVLAKKYINSIKNITSMIAGVALLYFAWGNTTILATFAVGILIRLLIKKEYFYPGLLLALSFFLGKEALLFFSSFVFLYGCLYGSMILKKRMKTFYVNAALFLLPFLLIWLEYIVGRYSQALIVAGIVILSKYVILRRSFKKIQ